MAIKISFTINHHYKDQVTFLGKLAPGGAPEPNELMVDFNGKKKTSNSVIIDENFINLEICLSYRKHTLFTLQLRPTDFYELLSSTRNEMEFCVGLPYVYVTNFHKKGGGKKQRIEHEAELANRVYFNAEKFSNGTIRLSDISVVFPKDLVYY